MKTAWHQLSLGKIRQKLADPDFCPSPTSLRALKRDPRIGVLQLVQQWEGRKRTQAREGRRIRRCQRMERALWRGGLKRIAGCDEVGVGPLAGPVVAAAVILPPHLIIEGLDDSKKLDEETRLRLAQDIQEAAVAVGIGQAEVEEIDEINIYQAARLAMRRAVEDLDPAPDFVLVDARTVPDIPMAQRALIKGDARSLSIAAASIVAKTFRDHLMEVLDQTHPGYGFARHKGYSTAAHFQAIQELGPCPVHRRSFAVLAELTGEFGPLFYSLRDQIERLETIEDSRRLLSRIRRANSALADPEKQRLRSLVSRRQSRLTSAQLHLFSD